MEVIVEIGQAHDGSLGILHSYIDAVAEAGSKIIKFQTHIPEAESSIHEPFRVNFSYEDKTRYDYWKRMSFTYDQWVEIKRHCDANGLEFMSSPFSNSAVDLLEKVGVKRYKIGSGEVNNFLLLERIAKTKKDVILSSGMSSYEELDNAAAFLKKRSVNFSILQCTTQYPTQPEDINLNLVKELKERYKVPTGLSDHSGTIFPGLAAAAIGADLLELHVVFDKKMFGPDTSSSITLNELKTLNKGIGVILRSLESNAHKKDNSKFKELKKIFEKSLAVNKDLPAGHVLTFDDLEAKKPSGFGIPATSFESVIGTSLNVNKRKWDFLTKENLS